MKPTLPILLALGLALTPILSGCAAAPEYMTSAVLRREVSEAEHAFARSMAQRDLQAFARHLADDAVFMAGDVPLRGKQQIVDAWAPFFEGATAPFSWEPELVEVFAGGTYAISSGPVRDPTGQVVARFTTLWRKDATGLWRAVFDQGCDACP
jgi:ketosteroid isomerase-like protein